MTTETLHTQIDGQEITHTLVPTTELEEMRLLLTQQGLQLAQIQETVLTLKEFADEFARLITAIGNNPMLQAMLPPGLIG
jgi:hypothetical protein